MNVAGFFLCHPKSLLTRCYSNKLCTRLHVVLKRILQRQPAKNDTTYNVRNHQVWAKDNSWFNVFIKSAGMFSKKTIESKWIFLLAAKRIGLIKRCLCCHWMAIYLIYIIRVLLGHYLASILWPCRRVFFHQVFSSFFTH